MKLIAVLALLLASLCSNIKAQSPFVKTYTFGDYRLEVGYCDYYSKLEVFYKDNAVSKFCDGEGGGYVLADTISLNNDGRPDFICSHMQEDGYSYIVFMVSKGEAYKLVDPDIYCSDLIMYGIEKSEDYNDLREFAVMDVDSDGKQDVLLNVLEKNGRIFPLPPPGTDTLGYDMLQWHITEFDTNSYWLPEKYVEAVAAGDTANAADYLFPVATFYDPFGKCLVVTYKSEALPQLMHANTINGVTKYRLKDLHYKINLAAVPPGRGNVYIGITKARQFPLEAFAERLELSVITIVRKGEKLLLEITDGAGTEQIYFIDWYKGKKLTRENFPVRYRNYATQR